MRTREELKEIAQEEFLRQLQKELTMPHDSCQVINENKESLFARYLADRYNSKAKHGEGTQFQELAADEHIIPYAAVNELKKKLFPGEPRIPYNIVHEDSKTYTAKIKRVGNPKTENIIDELKKRVDTDNKVYITYADLVNPEKS